MVKCVSQTFLLPWQIPVRNSLNEEIFILAHDFRSFCPQPADFYCFQAHEKAKRSRQKGIVEKQCSFYGDQEAQRGSGRGLEQDITPKNAPSVISSSNQATPLKVSTTSQNAIKVMKLNQSPHDVFTSQRLDPSPGGQVFNTQLFGGHFIFKP